MRPKREKGTERVVMVLGTRSRMTMTEEGSEGMSFGDILILCCLVGFGGREREGDGELELVRYRSEG